MLSLLLHNGENLKFNLYFFFVEAAMGANEKEFVLQWDGHAGYVTERFSGLLARQSLVDVTLICEEQKLRVHKLVLASCSLYFEVYHFFYHWFIKNLCSYFNNKLNSSVLERSRITC